MTTIRPENTETRYPGARRTKGAPSLNQNQCHACGTSNPTAFHEPYPASCTGCGSALKTHSVTHTQLHNLAHPRIRKTRMGDMARLAITHKPRPKPHTDHRENREVEKNAE